MPRFFNRQELTPEQKANWDSAIVKYKALMHENTTNMINNMTVEELQTTLESYGVDSKEQLYDKMQSMYSVMWNSPGDEKSALFARLLSGKQALIYAPPTSYSYPWYDVIETSGPWLVNHIDDAQSIDEFYYDYGHDEKSFVINQTSWKLLEKVSDQEAIVTYGKWEDLGFKWKIILEKIHTKDATSFIVAHHDDSLRRITTIEQLQKEQHWHALKHFYKIKLALDSNEYEQYSAAQEAKHGNFGIGIAKQEYQMGIAMLQKRRDNNLSDYPSDAEIGEYAKNATEKYFKRGYSVENGDLYINVWNMYRLSPETLSDDMYID